MKLRIPITVILLLCALVGNAQERDATQIVRDAINHWRGVSSDTVMSMVILDPDSTDLNTAGEIQMNFCRNIHFFASGEEVEQWAAGRGDIETLSLEEAFDLGSQLWPEAYSYAKTLSEAA